MKVSPLESDKANHVWKEEDLEEAWVLLEPEDHFADL